MSSNGGDSGVGVGQLYFCYTCSGTVSITPSSISDIFCPTCHGDFLLEYHQSPNPNPNNNLPIPISRGGIRRRRRFIWWPSGQRVHHQPSSHPPPPPRIGDRHPTPSEFLHRYVHYMIASGASAQVVEVFLQRLHGGYQCSTRPASRSAVVGLPTIQITEELLVGDSVQCAVCLDAFEVGDMAKQMPCKHIYHSKCILTWLEQHNTCPMCRYELPIEERRTRENEAPVANPNVTGVTAVVSSGGSPSPSPSPSSGGVRGSVSGSTVGTFRENPHRPRSMERRLRSFLRWPFRACGSPAETSNNDSQSNPGGSGN